MCLCVSAAYEENRANFQQPSLFLGNCEKGLAQYD